MIRNGMAGAVVVALAVALPALSPFAPGPSVNVVPLLLGGLCICALLACYRQCMARAVPWGWIIAALLSSLFGLLQYFDLDRYFTPWISRADVGEAYANLRQRNLFATFTNVGLASLMWWLTDRWERGDERMSPPIWLAVGLGIALLVAGNAASASRVGFLQLLALAALTASWRSRWQARLAAVGIAAILLYGIAALALPWLSMLALGVDGQNVFIRLGRQEGCASRQVLWANVLQLIAQRPWTGWGWGELDYAHYATLYGSERFCDILDNAHNLPLHLAVELGVPVALLMCVAVCWAIFKAAPWRATSATHRLAWSVLALIGAHSMLEYPLWYAPFHMAAGLCVVFLVATDPAASRAARAGPSWSVLLRGGASLLLAAAILFVWEDYRRASQPYLPYEQRNPSTRDLPPARIRTSLFHSQVRFAELTTTPLTQNNARYMAELAGQVLHFSPEPRVIEILIESLMLEKRENEALWHMARYRAAFAQEFAKWTAANSGGSRVQP